MITKSDIKNNFHLCSACKGEKFTCTHSHDCWGKPESYKTCCYTCGGYGFIINTHLKKLVEKELNIDTKKGF